MATNTLKSDKVLQRRQQIKKLQIKQWHVNHPEYYMRLYKVIIPAQKFMNYPRILARKQMKCFNGRCREKEKCVRAGQSFCSFQISSSESLRGTTSLSATLLFIHCCIFAALHKRQAEAAERNGSLWDATLETERRKWGGLCSLPIFCWTCFPPPSYFLSAPVTSVAGLLIRNRITEAVCTSHRTRVEHTLQIKTCILFL